MSDGTLETIDGRPALRFERQLEHSVERVWRAVSVPAELERWFPAAAEWTPAVGETFEAGGMTGEVTEVDEPHRLAWTFNGEHYSFELSAQDGGCLLVFIHVFDDRTRAAQTAAGWDDLLHPARAAPRRRLSLRAGGPRTLGGDPRALRGVLRDRSHSGPTVHRRPPRLRLIRSTAPASSRPAAGRVCARPGSASA